MKLKDNVAIVSWICERDYELVPIHCQAIRKRTDAPIYYIFDAKEKPPVIPGLDAVFIGSTFERQGNLNGQACLLSMFSFYTKLIEKGYQVIIKSDVDTLITSFDWIQPVIAQMTDGIGFHTANGYYWTGCTYCINDTIIKRVKMYLENNLIESHKSYHLPEDQVVTMLSAMTGCRIVILENTRMFQCVGFTENTISGVPYIRGVIHCGQWQRVNHELEKGRDRTSIVRDDMAACLKLIS